MANPIKNLLSNSKTRILVILGMVVLAALVFMGIWMAVRYMTGPSGPESQSDLNKTPRLRSIVGGWETPVSPEYAKNLEQYNKEQVDIAKKTGKSALPTLISSRTLTDEERLKLEASQAGEGVGFEKLAQLQRSDQQLKSIKDLEKGAVKLVYDKQGKVIGVIGVDGLVKDLCGNNVGKIGEDGLVVGIDGKPLGQVGTALMGALAHDAQGKVLGSVGADGLVRDSNGKIIGKVAPDGRVLDLNNKVIGQVGGVVPVGEATGIAAGTEVYDERGQKIGTVGSDGLVRDTAGKVIGKVRTDGRVVDANGKVIGQAQLEKKLPAQITTTPPTTPTTTTTAQPVPVSPTVLPGTPIYDATGTVIGSADADGVISDAKGNIIGQLGSDGIARDMSNNIMGRRENPSLSLTQTPSPAPAAPAASASLGFEERMSTVSPAQNRVLTDRQREQARQQMQTGMAAQANQLFAAWASPTQVYVAGGAPDQEQKGAAGATGPGKSSTAGGRSYAGGTQGGQVVPLLKAGTILFATLDTAINSDQPGPILATIVDGKLKGARLLGTMNRIDKTVTLNFNILTDEKFPSKVSIQAVAVDPDTARTALASEVDSHYLLRYGSLFAASFIQGYSNVLQSSGARLILPTSTTPNQPATYVRPDLTSRQKIFAALGTVGSRYQSVMASNFNTPPTVYVYAGTGLGILFTDDVAQPITGP